MGYRMPPPKVNAILRGGPADGMRVTLTAVSSDGLPHPAYVIPTPVGAHDSTGKARYLMDIRASAPLIFSDGIITTVLTFTHDKEFI